MSRLKTFAKYLLLLVGFYILSNVLINGFVNKNYSEISRKEIEESGYHININTAKASSRNGYIVGEITNNTGSDIDRIYIKADFYSPRDVNMGTEYYEVKNIKKGETKNFNIEFTYSDIDKYVLTTTENYEKRILKIKRLDLALWTIATASVLYYLLF